MQKTFLKNGYKNDFAKNEGMKIETSQLRKELSTIKNEIKKSIIEKNTINMVTKFKFMNL